MQIDQSFYSQTIRMDSDIEEKRQNAIERVCWWYKNQAVNTLMLNDVICNCHLSIPQ